jgi:hypothetical protein
MPEIKTFPVRLTHQANELLRNAYHYRGDLSSQLMMILETVNLRKIELKRFPTGRAARETKIEDRPLLKTSVRLNVDLYDQVKAVADSRTTSVNVVLNSAILAALAKL